MLIEVLAGVFEGVLMLSGCILLWRLVLSRRARAERPPAALKPWEILPSHFLLFLLFIVCGAYLTPKIAISLLRYHGLDQTTQTLAVMVAFELGALGSIALFHFGFAEDSTPATTPNPGAAVSGVATFLLSLPPVLVVTIACQLVFTAFGLPNKEQETIDFLMNLHTNLGRFIFALFAVVVAPVVEELVFRRGLFRYLRGRCSRRLALWGPAILFGLLHVNWGSLAGLASLAPLIVLGVIFSLAYERTGRITTSIVAHALFNLNSVVLVLLGVNT